MLDDIARLMRETQRETGRSALSERVAAAIAKVPRHRFVSPEQEPRAYLNQPLPIGSGQTISQPFIVALMTEFMDIKPTDRVLEIGTGSGYQAAVLAELAEKVYTIEIIESLGKTALARFQVLGYRNIETRIGDVQATERRLHRKLADDPHVRHLFLVLADTRHGRSVLATTRERLRVGFPLDTREVLAAFGAGRCPGANGIVVI